MTEADPTALTSQTPTTAPDQKLPPAGAAAFDAGDVAHRAATTRRRLKRAGRYLVAAIMAAWVLIPFYFLALLAVQSRADSLSVPPVWLPHPDFGNFTAVLSHLFSTGAASTPSGLIGPGIRNSAIVAVTVGLLNVALGAAAGYGFARFRFFGSRVLPTALLATQMVPAFALLVPYFVVLRDLGLTNTLRGIAVADTSITLPFTIYLLRAYFLGVPREVERAGRIDGCGRFAVFWRVALPLARPGLISAGLFAFMVAWNDFVFATVLADSQQTTLLQPAIAGLYNVRVQSFGLMAAGTILAALPTMAIALITQRYLVRGLLAGTGKG